MKRHLKVVPNELPHERVARERKDPEWRAAAGAAAKQLEESATGKGDLEEKLVETATMQTTQAGLPVNYMGELDTGASYRQRGRDARIVHGATAEDIAKYSALSVLTCGTCRHFKLREGREAIVKQKFLQRVVLEQEWKLSHLGAPTDHLGVCGQKPSMVTTTVTNAGTCEGYQPKDGIFRR